jgi:hypothetical protein
MTRVAAQRINAFRASTDSELVMTVRDPHGPAREVVVPCP